MTRLTLAALAVALLLAACSDEVPAPATPTTTPTQGTALSRVSLGQIAIVREGNLWLVDLDSGQETLLEEAGVAHTPKFSSDGRFIAYAEGSFAGGAGAGLFVVASDGSGQPQPVDRPVAFWEWSPVERILAYQLAADNSVWTYNASNGDKAQIIVPHQRRTPFAWSPDGRYLAYGVAEYTAGDQLVIGPSSVDVYDFETGTTRQLITGNDGAIPHVLSWSPERSRLAYWLSNISASINADGAELWWADLKGGATGLVGTTLMYNEAVAWKQTGETSVMAVSQGGGREVWTGKDLRLVRPDPPFPAQPLDVRVAAPGFSEVEPSWQPRGTSLAFVRIPEPKDAGASHVASLQKARIWTVRDDGTGEAQLTDDAAYSDRLPRFSSDGRQVLFLRQLTADWSEEAVAAALWIMDADGSNARQVADLGLVGWFGYCGRIDPEALLDWYHPDPTQGTARSCAPTAAGAFAEAQAALSFDVYCPSFLPAGLTLERSSYGPAKGSLGATPAGSDGLVVEFVDPATGSELNFYEGYLGNDLFPNWRQYPPPSPGPGKFGPAVGELYPEFEAGDLGLQPAVIIVWDLEGSTYVITARGLTTDILQQVGASMRPLRP